MNKRLMFKKVINIIIIPLMIMALALYLPDVYQCSLLTQATPEEYETMTACFIMVYNLQNTMWFTAAILAIIMLAFEYYKFKNSLSKQSQVDGQ